MSWKTIVGSVAPVLGAALGGPFGGMAGKFIAESLGVDEDKLEDAVLNADPETLLDIKRLDHEFKLKLDELGLKKEQLAAEDRNSARNMAINTTLLPQVIISSIFIMGFIGVLYLVFSGKTTLEGTMKETAIYVLGILSAGVTQVMNFFFGSSSGSKEKTGLLGKSKGT